MAPHKQYNPPVAKSIYFGTGDEGKKLLENLWQAKGEKSLSEYVVELCLKANPALLKGVKHVGK